MYEVVISLGGVQHGLSLSLSFFEYIKSLGFLLNFLIPVSVAGVAIFLRSWSKDRLSDYRMDPKTAVFIAGIIISSIPALMWSGITQRVIFMVLPGLVILACFFIKRYEKHWYAFVPLVILYVLSSFLMDSYILKVVNLPF